ncbi:MAG: hypothetical protein KH828_00485 [Clostridiales bacterium]|nr:hypothetical protein [Clostridiales bacterium]
MTGVLDYLKQMIDDEATLEEWDAKQYLNLHLAGSYMYYRVTVLAETFLLIKPVEEQTIQKMKTHIFRIKEKTGYEAAVLVEQGTPYRVKKMLEERIAFLTEDRQMYLPFLALHIRKTQEKRAEAENKEQFTAATQMVFLALLYARQTEFCTEELVNDLKLSTMTILRAADELKKIGIVKCDIGGKTGRKKVFRPIEKKEYYRIGKEYLINPVKKSFYVSHIPNEVNAYKGGLTALAEQTLLGEPGNETYAVYGKISELEKYQVTKIQALTEGMPEIQLMQYDIGRLTENQYIDPITLNLSLKEKDDRTEIAIDELMRGIEWYGE